MTGALVALAALAAPGEPCAERAEGAMMEGRPLAARDEVLQAVEATGPDRSLYLLYLRSSEGAGLGARAQEELSVMGGEEARWALAARRALRDPSAVGGLDSSPESQAVRAVALLQQGAPRAALEALGETPADPWGVSLRVEALALAEARRDAAAVARDGLARFPDHPEIASGLWATERRGGLRRARRQALHFTLDALDAADATYAWRARSLLIAAGRSPAPAADRLEALGERRPLDRPLWSETMRGAVARALVDVGNPAQLPPAADQELLALADRISELLADAGQLDEALAVWEAARGRADSGRAALSHGELLLRAGDAEGAQRAADAGLWLAARPTQRDAEGMDLSHLQRLLARGWALRASLGVPGAEAISGALRGASGGEPDERPLLEASAALAEGDPSRAALLADQGLAAAAGHRGALGLALALRGQARGAQGDEQGALVDLTTAILLHPAPPAEWLWGRGTLLERQGDTDGAFAWYAVGASAKAASLEPLERTWRGVGEWEDGARAATARWTTEKSAQAVYQPEVGQRRSGPVAGEIFPPWELSAEGIQIDSAALRGEVVILAFWASWCEPCQEELPELSALARRAADEGLPIRVIAVSMDESPRDYGRGRARLDLEGITVARDPVLGQRLRVSGLPSTWLVAPDGTATRLFSGYRKGQVQELEIAARALLTGQE